ncbi:Fe(3+)-citrate-binding protein YfmC precursor [compost metagenome]
MKKRSIKLLFPTMVLCLVLAACGNGNSANSAKESANSSGAANTQNSQNQNAANTASEATHTIKHGLGTTEIKGKPQRIVALEFTYAEDLVALGVDPVGVADVEGYKKWVNTTPGLPDGVADVGTRQEPNLEAIMALEPDLIITADYRAANIYDKLTEIAPTIAFSPYQDENGVDQYQEMIDTFNTIAEITGKQDEAAKVLKDLDDTYAAATEKLKAAGKENGTVTLVQAYSNQNAPVFRIFTDNSMSIQILKKIGLTNAFKESAFELYGYAEKTVESFPAVQDSNFIYIVQADDNVFEDQLKDNKVWTNLNFVKENRTYALGGDSWVFGGPLSAKTIVNKAVELLAP